MVIEMAKDGNKIKGLFVLSILVIGIVFGAYYLSNNQDKTYTYEVKSFNSYDELSNFLQNNYQSYDNTQYYWDSLGSTRNIISMPEADGSSSKASEGGSSDYSTTNVQVEGVDEPDMVKTDGTYLYVLADQVLYILRANPAVNATILSKIIFEDDEYITEFFINGNYLVVFGSSNNYPILYGGIEKDFISTEEVRVDESWSVSTSVIKIYDTSTKLSPELVKDIEIDGNYYDSRMIGKYVYVVSSEYSYNFFRYELDNYTLNIPEITIDNVSEKISYDSIYYIDSPEVVDTMTHIISINLDDLSVNEQSFLIGVSENMYMSKNNVYLVYTNYEYFATSARDFGSYREYTIIHKIQVDQGEINYVNRNQVPGHVLNQFSMDEHNNYFRIATTVGSSWDENNPSRNNIHILDENLDNVSSIEGIAEGEQIYSARFMGDRAYLVTFKKIDPFFTIDLSDPFNPRVMGYLKIPGYSDYLHPYDENHIIGIGKDTVVANEGDFLWHQGVKVALFDVSDFENPVEVDNMIIGDRGTDSPALYDHKAFLFDKEKELLVIPISLYEINDEVKSQYDEIPPYEYGEFTFQGAYVLNLNLEGFSYKGKITHISEEDKIEQQKWWYWRESSSYISRSLYIDDVLYTISNKMVKMNDLDDLREINIVTFSE